MCSAVIKKTACIILLSFLGRKANAQSQFPKYEYGIMGGTLIYQGDLSPSPLGTYQHLKPAIQLFASKVLDESFALRANISRGSIDGNDAWYASPAWRRVRNFSFNTSITELSANLVWNFYSYHPEGTVKKLSTYVFGGAGFSVLQVQRDWSHLNMAALGTENSFTKGLGADTIHTPPSIIPVLPFGAGVRYQISPELSIAAEFTYRITFTDYLDGFSKSANPNMNDFYYGYSVGLVYSPEKNLLRCPKIVQ